MVRDDTVRVEPSVETSAPPPPPDAAPAPPPPAPTRLIAPVPNAHRPPLVLASGSPYRKQLLERLRLPFVVDVANVDETARDGEAPADTASRLSVAKARTVATRRRDAVVVGSDQVAECEGRPFGKPGTHEAAVLQLRTLRGRTVLFHSGLCLVSPAHEDDAPVRVITTAVRYRDVDDDTIERYLRVEEPYDCAGSAKAEGLGIALVERIDSDDPTALVGLPLIALVTMLDAIAYPLFGR